MSRDGGFGGGGACNSRSDAGRGYSAGSVYVNISAELTGGGGSFVPSNTCSAAGLEKRRWIRHYSVTRMITDKI